MNIRIFSKIWVDRSASTSKQQSTNFFSKRSNKFTSKWLFSHHIPQGGSLNCLVIIYYNRQVISQESTTKDVKLVGYDFRGHTRGTLVVGIAYGYVLLSGGHLFVFVEYLCKRSPKIKTKNIKNYSSILAIVNHRNWLDDSPPLRWPPKLRVKHALICGDLLIFNWLWRYKHKFTSYLRIFRLKMDESLGKCPSSFLQLTSATPTSFRPTRVSSSLHRFFPNLPKIAGVLKIAAAWVCNHVKLHLHEQLNISKTQHKLQLYTKKLLPRILITILMVTYDLMH